MNAIQNIISQHHDISIKNAYNVDRLIIPFYHEDGDMYDVFIKELDNNEILLYDNGLTLMRVSYSISIDSKHKTEILNKILNENKIINDQGDLQLRTTIEDFSIALNHYCTTIAKITNMRILTREGVSSLFYDYVEDFIFSKLEPKYKIDRHYKLPNELTVKTYKINTRKPVFIFPVKDELAASRATVGWNELKKVETSSISVGICEELDKINRYDKYFFVNSMDKTFPQFNDFRDNITDYIDRFAI